MDAKEKLKKLGATGVLFTVLLGLVNEARTAIVDNTKTINEISRKASVNESKIQDITEHYKDIKTDVREIKKILLRGRR